MDSRYGSCLEKIAFRLRSPAGLIKPVVPRKPLVHRNYRSPQSTLDIGTRHEAEMTIFRLLHLLNPRIDRLFTDSRVSDHGEKTIARLERSVICVVQIDITTRVQDGCIPTNLA
jgi:hypothetical protein